MFSTPSIPQAATREAATSWKRWPLIRHIRAIRLWSRLVDRAISIWGITDKDEAFAFIQQFYPKDCDQAHQIWIGRA